MPLYILGANAILKGFAAHMELRLTLSLLWGIVGFIAPVLYSTVDVAYLRRSHRLSWAVMFRPYTAPDAGSSSNNLRGFYIPTWQRLAALFASAVVSTLVMRSIGVNF
ncbi:hypothetical protein [Candidatus Laterigemmans baculatus]|uniref:hypothetical protein n=1 Tax=Candidatus Laterigemmans baculatus TaxID=2770505 RepID=UPI0013DC8000|nr:hypothetical protein [Candidatus Laterigemmans baculatus]